MKNALPALLLALAGCGTGAGQDPVENTADQLEDAARQSDPAAAEVMTDTADQVREQNSTAPAQDVLEEAANASTEAQAEQQRLEDVANTPESAPER